MLYYREFFASGLIRFIGGMSLLGAFLTAAYFNGYSTILLLIVGAVIYALAEYTVHRYLLHEFPRLAPILFAGHEQHHKHPQDIKYLFGPVYYDMAIYAIYMVAAWLAFRQLPPVVALVTGTLLFQFYYQWMHYAAHRPIAPRTAWGRWMKKKHLLHHFKDEHTWYGVSHPVLDYVMGSDKADGRHHADAPTIGKK